MNFIFKTFLYIFLLYGLVCSTSFAQSKDLEDRSLIAEKYYKQGLYQEAFDIYELLLNDSNNPALFFNAGNCQYLLKNYGKAYYFFSMAIKHLEPPYPKDVLHNLNLVINKLVENKVEILKEKPDSFLIQDYTILNKYGKIGFIILYILFFVLILILKKTSSKTTFRIFTVGCILCLNCTIYLGINLFYTRECLGGGRKLALPGSFYKRAIIYDDAIVRASPMQDSQIVNQIKSGREVLVKESLNEWIKLRVEDGRVGWVNSSFIKYF